MTKHVAFLSVVQNSLTNNGFSIEDVTDCRFGRTHPTYTGEHHLGGEGREREMCVWVVFFVRTLLIHGLLSVEEKRAMGAISPNAKSDGVLCELVKLETFPFR